MTDNEGGPWRDGKKIQFYKYEKSDSIVYAIQAYGAPHKLSDYVIHLGVDINSVLLSKTDLLFSLKSDTSIVGYYKRSDCAKFFWRLMMNPHNFKFEHFREAWERDK